MNNAFLTPINLPSSLNFFVISIIGHLAYRMLFHYLSICIAIGFGFLKICKVALSLNTTRQWVLCCNNVRARRIITPLPLLFHSVKMVKRLIIPCHGVNTERHTNWYTEYIWEAFSVLQARPPSHIE